MQHILALWQSLPLRRRALFVGTAAAVLMGVAILYSFAARPSMALLYSGLEGSSAGEVLAALDQRGVPYQVRGAAIYVEAGQRDSLRMALASDGLPANAGTGYELLDTMSGFGTTSQMFDVAYWRAKEGELARTITTGLGLRTARVHIATPTAQGLRARTRSSASVTVSPRAGAFTEKQARALRYLVASAVPGMAPEDVSVIDATTGLLIAADSATAGQSDEREEALRQNVERLLEARVGAGNAIVEVSLDTVTEREAITERRIDPQGRVAISTDTEEKSATSKEAADGAVTVASNLPEGDSAKGAGSQNQNSQTRERVNFEVSQTTREVLRAPGAVKRLTVAVLVNAGAATDANGQTSVQPRAEEELAALKELVASAVGFDEARGDVITLKSLPFEAVQPVGSEASTLTLLDRIDLMTVIQIASVALVTLILGLFVLRPILASGSGRPLGLPSPAPTTGSGALTGEIDDRTDFPGTLPTLADPARGLAAPLAITPEPGADPVDRLRALVAERQSETVEVLRSWIDGSGGEART